MKLCLFFIKHKSILLYSASLAGLLFLLKWLELRFIIFDHTLEIYIGAIAIIFTGLGIWLALKLTRPKIETVVVEKEIFIEKKQDFVFNEAEMEKLGLSKRELEVLKLMAEGFSNVEIGTVYLFSLNTVKTHISNLFFKTGCTTPHPGSRKSKKAYADTLRKWYFGMNFTYKNHKSPESMSVK